MAAMCSGRVSVTLILEPLCVQLRQGHTAEKGRQRVVLRVSDLTDVPLRKRWRCGCPGHRADTDAKRLPTGLASALRSGSCHRKKSATECSGAWREPSCPAQPYSLREADPVASPSCSGLMKGWKASTFNVPWALSKTTHLGGSRHDKNREQWEKESALAFLSSGTEPNTSSAPLKRSYKPLSTDGSKLYKNRVD